MKLQQFHSAMNAARLPPIPTTQQQLHTQQQPQDNYTRSPTPSDAGLERQIRETNHIKDRLGTLAQMQYDLHHTDQDVRRLMAVQFRELHKMLLYCVDKVFTLSQDLAHGYRRLDDRMATNHHSLAVRMTEIQGVLDRHHAPDGQNILAQLYGELNAFQHRMEVVMQQREARTDQRTDALLVGVKERIDYVYAGLQMQLRDAVGVQHPKQTDSTLVEAYVRARVDPVVEKMEAFKDHQNQSNQSLAAQVQALQDRIKALEEHQADKEKALVDRIAHLEQQLASSSMGLASRLTEQERVSSDIVTTFASLKDAIRLLSRPNSNR